MYFTPALIKIIVYKILKVNIFEMLMTNLIVSFWNIKDSHIHFGGQNNNMMKMINQLIGIQSESQYIYIAYVIFMFEFQWHIENNSDNFLLI